MMNLTVDAICSQAARIGKANLDALRRLAKGLPRDKEFKLLDIQRTTSFFTGCNARGMDDEAVMDCIPRLEESCKKNNISIQGTVLLAADDYK